MQLSFIDGYLDTEIAKILRISQQAVTKTKHNALSKLRKYIREGI